MTVNNIMSRYGVLSKQPCKTKLLQACSNVMYRNLFRQYYFKGNELCTKMTLQYVIHRQMSN